MVFLNQKQLIGNIIPDIKIAKIKLEARGGEDLFRNPHIDHEREPDVFIDPRTGKRVRENIIDVAARNRKDRTGKSIRVTVDLMLQDKQNDSLKSQWFDNEEFKNYLRIRLFQIRDEDISIALSQNQKFFNFLYQNVTPNKTNIEEQNILEFAQVLNLVNQVGQLQISQASLTNIPTINIPRTVSVNVPAPESIQTIVQNQETFVVLKDQFRKKIQNGVISRVFNVSRDIEGNSNNILKHYVEIDSEGNKIRKFIFRTSFIIPNANPEFLSYFAFTHLDMPQLAQDFNLSPDIGKLISPNGNIFSDIVIRNGRVLDKSFVFFDQTNKIFGGAVQQTNNGFFGLNRFGAPVPLRREQVSNSKLEDDRDFESLDKLVVDFSFIENEVSRVVLDNIRNKEVSVKMPDSFFSNLNLSRDNSGNVRFSFAADIRRIMEKFSKFGKLFSNSKTSQQAIQNSKILSMEISRYRVSGSPKLGSSQKKEIFNTTPITHGQNYISKRVSISGEKTFKNFNIVNDDIGSLREITNLYLEGQDVHGIRHFTGVDKTMPNVTDGYYRYRVKMELEDAGAEFLRVKLNELVQAKRTFEGFFEEAINVFTSGRFIHVDDPHIEEPGIPRDEGEFKIGNFDPILNRFTQEFINKQLDKYRLIPNPENNQLIRLGPPPPWLVAVNAYVSLLDILSDEQQIDFEKIKERLLFFIHPVTGTPSGMQKFLGLMQKLQKQIETALGLSNGEQGLNSIRAQAQNKSVSQSKITRAHSPLKIINIDYSFIESFSAGTSVNVGFNYLNIFPINDDIGSLKTITSEEYNNRIQQENDFYFIRREGINPDIDLEVGDEVFTDNDQIDNTSWTYLSPANIKLGGNITLNRLGPLASPKIPTVDLLHIQLAIQLYNLGFKKEATQVNLIEERTRDATQNQINNNNDTLSLAKRIENLSNNLMANFGLVTVDGVKNTNNQPVVNANTQQNNATRQQQTVDNIVQVNDNSQLSIENRDISNATVLMIELINRTPPRFLDVTPQTLERKNNSFRPVSIEPAFASNVRVPQNENSIRKIVNIEYFDLNSSNNRLAKVKSNPTLLNAEEFFQGAPHSNNPTLNEAFKALPNQIKSIYLSSIKPSVTKRNWFLNDPDIVFSRQVEPEFTLSHRMLKTVVYLRGYGTDENGNIQIKKPIWEPLTLNKFNDSIGDGILCRLRSYSNKIVGIERKPEAELSIFDEFFMIRPRQRATVNTQANNALLPTNITAVTPNTSVRVEIPRDELIKFSAGNNIDLNIIAERDSEGNLPLEEIRQIAQDSRVNSLNLKIREPIQQVEQNQTQQANSNLQLEDFLQTQIRTEFMYSNLVNHRSGV